MISEKTLIVLSKVYFSLGLLALIASVVMAIVSKKAIFLAYGTAALLICILTSAGLIALAKISNSLKQIKKR